MASRAVTTVQSLQSAAKTKHSDQAAAWHPIVLAEQHNERLEKLWSRVPGLLRGTLLSFAVFLMGLAVSGNFVMIYVHLRRQLELGLEDIPDRLGTALPWNLKYLDNFGTMWMISNAVSYGVYFIMGGFIHWYYYIRRRDSAVEWKLQPDKWLSRDLELHEIKVGTLSLLVSGTFSALMGSYVANGGWSMVYYNWSDYGLLWGILQWPAIFLYQDYATFLVHRALHTPWLYKHFHKVHHKYKQPTAFSVTAIHPAEMLFIQITCCVPLFVIPCHWLSFYLIALYTYYHGIIVHTGVNLKAAWWQPWQPDAIFHDRHHEFTHVNFGFNFWLWDKIHGTYMHTEAAPFYRSHY